jgi:hypothetical protein
MCVKILKACVVTVSVLACILWLALLFCAFFLGGAPGPGYERTVPVSYCGVMLFGLVGAVLGTVGIGESKSKYLIPAAVLELAGSIPLFLLELPVVGAVYMILGVLPLSGLLLLQMGNAAQEKRNIR